MKRSLITCLLSLLASTASAGEFLDHFHALSKVAVQFALSGEPQVVQDVALCLVQRQPLTEREAYILSGKDTLISEAQTAVYHRIFDRFKEGLERDAMDLIHALRSSDAINFEYKVVWERRVGQ